MKNIVQIEKNVYSVNNGKYELHRTGETEKVLPGVYQEKYEVYRKVGEFDALQNVGDLITYSYTDLDKILNLLQKNQIKEWFEKYGDIDGLALASMGIEDVKIEETWTYAEYSIEVEEEYCTGTAEEILNWWEENKKWFADQMDIKDIDFYRQIAYGIPKDLYTLQELLKKTDLEYDFEEI